MNQLNRNLSTEMQQTKKKKSNYTYEGNNSPSYLYSVGTADKRRLDILNGIYNPSSKKALLGAGLKNKRCVIDIACGQGELTCWMAQELYNKGVVIGIDINEVQIAIARQRALEQGLNNVKFINMSVLDLDRKKIETQFNLLPDLIYCRYLLVHLFNDQVKNVIKTLFDLLSSKGVVVHEECTLFGSINDDNSGFKGFKKYLDLFDELAKKVNINFDVGVDLERLLKEAGYNKVESQIIKPKLTKEQHDYLYLDLYTITPALKENNIADDEYISAVKNQLSAELSLDTESHITQANYIALGLKE